VLNTLNTIRVPDLALPRQHPKRVFVHRALELEIRLSYYDRILKTLPEPFQDPSNSAMPDQAPGPNYEYEDPGMFAQFFWLMTPFTL
jgi:nuclear cap-binding protein subunit 1